MTMYRILFQYPIFIFKYKYLIVSIKFINYLKLNIKSKICGTDGVAFEMQLTEFNHYFTLVLIYNLLYRIKNILILNLSYELILNQSFKNKLI